MEAPVVAVSVITSAPLEIDLRTYTTELREQGERLQAEALDALSGLDQVEAMAVPAPSPARELDRIAGQRRAAMIVLGSTHRGAIGRVVPGTVADRLLAGGRCPVAVAPKGFSSLATTPARIGVAFDGSREARVALRAAASLAAAAGASLDLIAVVNPVMPAELPLAAHGYAGLVVSPRITSQQLDYMRDSARAAVTELVSDQVTATIQVLEGTPTETLLERSGQLDLLVLGSRGYGPFDRVLMGSVSTAVLRQAACPVIVTPRPERPSNAAEAGDHREAVSA
jgi:nucleotide-binding universal stress UspA family protein